MKKAISLMFLMLLGGCVQKNDHNTDICSLSATICQKNYVSLSNGIKKFEASGGLLIIMNLKTFEIVEKITIGVENFRYKPDNIIKHSIVQENVSPEEMLLAYTSLVNNKQKKLIKLRKILRDNIVIGIGKNADVQGANVHGVTSTDFKSQNNKEVYTTFLGDFTSKEQEYSLIMVLDAPQGIKSSYGYKTSGWNSARIAREVIQNIIE